MWSKTSVSDNLRTNNPTPDEDDEDDDDEAEENSEREKERIFASVTE